MVTNNNLVKQEAERKWLKIIQIIYIGIWLILWFVQRTSEFVVIEQLANNNEKSVSHNIRLTI